MLYGVLTFDLPATCALLNGLAKVANYYHPAPTIGTIGLATTLVTLWRVC